MLLPSPQKLAPTTGTTMHANDRAAAAASLIRRHWRDGTSLTALPAEIRPVSRAEGYAAQARLGEDGEVPFGWKIAATSAAGQAHIGVDGPLAGRIFAERVRLPDAILSLAGNRMRVAELEFAFRFGRDLAPRATDYGEAEVLTAVASLHPAIEVPNSRFDDFATAGAAQLIADDACAHEFVLGPAVTADWRELDLAAHPVVATIDGPGGRWARDGIGANVLGDPRIALVWLVNELSAHGVTLLAGQVVTTGTCVVPVEIGPGDRVAGDFGVLGSVAVRFAAAG